MGADAENTLRNTVLWEVDVATGSDFKWVEYLKLSFFFFKDK